MAVSQKAQIEVYKHNTSPFIDRKKGTGGWDLAILSPHSPVAII